MHKIKKELDFMQNVLECSAWNAWLFSIEQWNYKRRVRK